MKRLDLVQLTIIIVGIMSAYCCLEIVPTFFVYLLGWFNEGLSGSYSMQYFIYAILMLALYLIFSIYTIKHSKQLAEYLCNKSNMEADVNFSINKKELLYVLFIGLGAYGLIKNVPIFIKDIYDKITAEKDVFKYPIGVRLPGSDVYTEGITISLYFILVYYANIFAEFLAAKIKNTEPADEINSRNES